MSLNTIKQKLQKTLQSLTGETIADTGGDLDGSTTEITEMSAIVAEHNSAQVRQIIKAIQKIDNNTYGTCDECGKQIGKARLLAMPYAQNCIECQSAIDRKRK